MAKGGKVQHWKHGWIPLTPWAKAYADGATKTRPDGSKVAPPLKVAKEIAANKPNLKLQAAPARQRTNVPGGALIDSMRNNGGFTYDPKKNELISVGDIQGVAVARPGTEVPVGNGDISRQDFGRAIADLIDSRWDEFQAGAKLGGWYSEDRDQYMVEVTDIITDRDEAIRLGKERNQEGIFDLGTGEFIPTGGTGDGPANLALTDGYDPGILDRAFDAPNPTPVSSFSAPVSSSWVDPLDLDMDGNLKTASTGPGQPFWPEGVPAIKDVAIRNQEDGERLAESWKVSGPVLAKYEALEPNVTPTLEAVAASVDGEMVGLKNKLKERGSLARKLYSKSPSKGLTPQGYADALGDALRYTMVADNDLAKGAQKVLDDFRAQGYTVEVENTFGIPNTRYKGINTNISKGGLTFELQFHTPDSFVAKDQQHGLYDIARSDKYTPEERAAANAQMEANMRAVHNPPGIEDVR